MNNINQAWSRLKIYMNNPNQIVNNTDMVITLLGRGKKDLKLIMKYFGIKKFDDNINFEQYLKLITS